MTTTRPFKAEHTGTITAPGIPAGARLVATSWHVALFYGPSAPYPTEADALRDALTEAENAAARMPGFAPRITIDLRWKMEWEQGSPDPNGRPTASSGAEFTVARTSYLTPGDAAQRLANIEHVYGEPSVPTLGNGDTLTIRGEAVEVTIP